MPSIPRTEFVAFIDEAGDYGLEDIDANMPVFATCALTMTVEDYVRAAIPMMQWVKYHFFGTETVVFHGHKIRQRAGPFSILKDEALRNEFMDAVTHCFEQLPPNSLICAAIKKAEHKAQYVDPGDPFALSLCFLLERLEMHWAGKLHDKRRLLCVFEKRGPDEDARTRKTFTEVCAGKNHRQRVFHFDIDFRHKQDNVVGHQYADLAAFSLARFVETGREDRKDWQAVKPKVRCSPQGRMTGWGLKIFPS
jgi:hypothetical protein